MIPSRFSRDRVDDPRLFCNPFFLSRCSLLSLSLPRLCRLDRSALAASLRRHCLHYSHPLRPTPGPHPLPPGAAFNGRLPYPNIKFASGDIHDCHSRTHSKLLHRQSRVSTHIVTRDKSDSPTVRHIWLPPRLPCTIFCSTSNGAHFFTIRWYERCLQMGSLRCCMLEETVRP